MSLQSRSMSNFLLRNLLSRHFSSQVQKTNQPSSLSSETPQEVTIVSPMKRRILVWCGFYKNVNDVPQHVSKHTMIKCMDKFRVRMSLAIMAFCCCGALSSILLAKDTVVFIEEEREKSNKD